MLYERLPILEVKDFAILCILQTGAPFGGHCLFANQPKAQGVEPGLGKCFLGVGEHGVH